jgi:hypothetical protein
MKKLLQSAQSRGNWTAVVLFLINAIPAIEGYVPEQWKVLVNGVLVLLTFYFKVNPSQNYTS